MALSLLFSYWGVTVPVLIRVFYPYIRGKFHLILLYLGSHLIKFTICSLPILLMLYQFHTCPLSSGYFKLLTVPYYKLLIFFIFMKLHWNTVLDKLKKQTKTELLLWKQGVTPSTPSSYLLPSPTHRLSCSYWILSTCLLLLHLASYFSHIRVFILGSLF